MSVLVADDQGASRLVLTGILRKAGHRAHAAATGDEALEFLSHHRCDVALLDVHMPGTGGIDVLRLARVMEAGARRRTRFVMLSADTSPSLRSNCMTNGASAFLSKADHDRRGSRCGRGAVRARCLRSCVGTTRRRRHARALRSVRRVSNRSPGDPCIFRRVRARCVCKYRRFGAHGFDAAMACAPRSLPRAARCREQCGRHRLGGCCV
jgi:CheY-like chemotaxis protein